MRRDCRGGERAWDPQFADWEDAPWRVEERRGIADIRIDGEGQPHREKRLTSALVYANGVLRDADMPLTSYVAGVQDHEGQLTVTWKSEPGAIGRKLMERAWEFVGECACNLIHELESPEEHAP